MNELRYVVCTASNCNAVFFNVDVLRDTNLILRKNLLKINKICYERRFENVKFKRNFVSRLNLSEFHFIKLRKKRSIATTHCQS